MRSKTLYSFAVLCVAAMIPTHAAADVIYDNLTPNSLMGVASRAAAPGVGEMESADDFVLGTASTIDFASFTGVIATGFGTPQVSGVTIEIYRVFPNDSDTVRPPDVKTRINSPSDVAFDSRSSSVAGDLAFSTAILAGSFTTNNSVMAGGIHPAPNQTTGGNGPITGQEVQFDVNFLNPIDLPADHYFFVAQVDLTNGGSFYWLSAERPITSGTVIVPDLQAWIRDENLSPDWSRIGTDIVGGTNPPSFNLAFSLDGKPDASVPEPASSALLIAGMAMVAGLRKCVSKN